MNRISEYLERDRPTKAHADALKELGRIIDLIAAETVHCASPLELGGMLLAKNEVMELAPKLLDNPPSKPHLIARAAVEAIEEMRNIPCMSVTTVYERKGMNRAWMVCVRRESELKDREEAAARVADLGKDSRTIARMNGARRAWSCRWVAGALMMLALALCALAADWMAKW